MKLTDVQKAEIIDLYSAGVSISSIAKEVLGRRTRKSTVSSFLKRYRDEMAEYDSSVDESPKPAIKKHNAPKIVIIDIETSPAISYHWKRWDENIHQDQVIQESIILTFSAKYLGNDDIVYDYVTEEEVKRFDDKRVVSHIYDILNDADIVIAHNGRRFDKKKINTRLLFHGFKPTTPYRLFDTLVSAKANFAFPSNSLDNICAYLGLERKLKHDGFKLWRGYLEGDKSCIEKMVEYNIQDVVILEEVYLVLRSWDRMHPNVSVYSDLEKHVCVCCGSVNVDEMDGEIATTNISGYQVYECQDCGKKMRGRKNILDKKTKFTNISS